MAKAVCGGIKSARDVRAYKPPQGPTSIDNPHAPGLHGSIYARGSQGIKSFKEHEHGQAGISPKRLRHGSQK